MLWVAETGGIVIAEITAPDDDTAREKFRPLLKMAGGGWLRSWKDAGEYVRLAEMERPKHRTGAWA